VKRAKRKLRQAQKFNDWEASMWTTWQVLGRAEGIAQAVAARMVLEGDRVSEMHMTIIRVKAARAVAERMAAQP
jgi:hypothetical protein